MRSFRACTLFLFFSLATTLGAIADELKLVDNLGLTRAIKPIKEQAKVTVNFSAPVSEASLVSVSGLGGELKGQKSGDASVFFPSVPPGTWRIESSGAKPQVSKVSIE